jgi:2-succinyl-6-hydroxy-2,4-cyclohexadiene-1-carboxylate synthase
MARVAVRDVTLNVETEGRGPALVLLHGFTGSSATWRPFLPRFSTRRAIVAIDILGHGGSDAPAASQRYAIEQASADVTAVLDRLAIAQAAVLGYSMGGRIGLYLAAAAPERVTALILESASPGIAEPSRRRARAEEDAARADAIEREGVAAFVDRWERLPLFASQGRLALALRAELRAQRLANSARGLANSLRGLGQGVQPPLFDRLETVAMPALVIAGALDTAYTAIGRTLCRRMPDARLVVIAGAGHAVHLEQPAAFENAVTDFLDQVAPAAQAPAAAGGAECRSAGQQTG